MSSPGNFHKWRVVFVGLLLHYIKIAFRNIWKYKSQSLINIAGLATGLTCFALSTLWIRYETSFDNSHNNAKQLYVIYRQTGAGKTEIGKKIPIPYAAYLKETFPEIKSAAPVWAYPLIMGEFVILEGVEIPATTIAVDSNFFRMFDLKIVAGSSEFLNPGSGQMAITQEKARQLFGNNNPIGKIISTWRRTETFTIGAVISQMPKPSNYPFDFIRPFTEEESQNWNITDANIIIELFPGTDFEVFEKKLKEHKSNIAIPNAPQFSDMFPMPLNKMRYTAPDIERNVKFQDILIFSISGLLVVLCSLFNYFISMACYFRIRQKELALRLVYGASGHSLLAMLSVEFLLILLFAVILGILFTQLFYKPFLTLSKIQMDLSAIYLESLMYIGIIMFVVLLFFFLILFVFRRRSKNRYIRRSDNKLFRKSSTVVQLAISMFFVFCTIIIQKQMYFLHHSHELGFSFQNRGLIWNVPNESSEILANQLKQIPEITEVIEYKGMSGIFPPYNTGNYEERSWENKPVDIESFRILVYRVSPELVDFYDFHLLEGEMLTASDPELSVMISEDAARAYGWHDPVGKQILNEFGSLTVKGVVKNVYNYGPTQQILPAAFLLQKAYPASRCPVLFKYREGLWKSCKEKVDRLIEAEYADSKQENSRYNSFIVQNFEEEYNEILKSEIALQKLFSVFSTICVLICVFGFVSLVSLSCKERRKSIAIRKINGATSFDIIVVFVKEYAWLLIIGSVIAFSVGYFFMRRWLEHYVKQTNIPVWIYLSILTAMATVIVLCVGRQVYKTSIENPIEAIKSE